MGSKRGPQSQVLCNFIIIAIIVNDFMQQGSLSSLYYLVARDSI